MMAPCLCQARDPTGPALEPGDMRRTQNLGRAKTGSGQASVTKTPAASPAVLTGEVSPPRKHLAISGGVLGCPLGRGATKMCRVERGGAAEQPAGRGCPPQNKPYAAPAPMVPRLRKPALNGGARLSSVCSGGAVFSPDVLLEVKPSPQRLGFPHPRRAGLET